MPLRIASINIERSKHRKRVKPFLEKFQPDVVLLQELCPRDLPTLMGLQYKHFTYCAQRLHWKKGMPFGLGILSRTLQHSIRICDLSGNEDLSHITGHTHEERAIFATVHDNEQRPYRLATTHFKVTEEGSVTPEQMQSVSALVFLAQQEAAAHDGLLLTGDFNAPRGRAAFDTIAMYFQDGVPAHYTSSIDGKLHRDGPIEFMVDGLFHSPTYHLKNVVMHDGVSDHCAFTGELSHA